MLSGTTRRRLGGSEKRRRLKKTKSSAKRGNGNTHSKRWVCMLSHMVILSGI
jgi:hypothetical protein